MPKVLIFRDIWIFVIYGTDKYENRKHVHVGKKATLNLCRIWIDPLIEVADPDDLSQKQQNEVIDIVKLYKNELIQQWEFFFEGKNIKTIKVK